MTQETYRPLKSLGRLRRRVRLTPIKKVIATVAGVIGLLSALFVLIPRVNVKLAGSTDAKNEFAAIVSIQNLGFVPVYNVKASLGICDIQINGNIEDGRRINSACVGKLKTIIHKNGWNVDKITMDAEHAFPLDDIISLEDQARLTNADISIIVEYTPYLLPFADRKEFGFKSRVHKDGKVDWLSVSRK